MAVRIAWDKSTKDFGHLREIFPWPLGKMKAHSPAILLLFAPRIVGSYSTRYCAFILDEAVRQMEDINAMSEVFEVDRYFVSNIILKGYDFNVDEF